MCEPAGSSKRRSGRSRDGFSILELLVVLAVVATVAAIAVPQLMRAFNRSRQRRTMADMRSIAAANGAYHVDSGAYVAALGDLSPEYLQPPGADAWGNALVYAGGGSAYTLTSYGLDGVPGPAPPSPWTAEPFEPDLVVANGTFTQAPTDR